MNKTAILFVCLGNICRSPMAEAAFNKLIEEEGRTDEFEVDSAGLISVHQGELPDSRMRHHASMRGYKFTHRSRPVTKADMEHYDMVIGMDEENIAGLNRLASTPEQKAKIYSMTDFSRQFTADSVPDPYYGGAQGFEFVIDLLEDACEGLLNTITAP